MAKIRINGDTSGYIEISAPAVAGSTSITLPATTGGSLLATDASGNLNVDSGTLYVDGSNNRVGIGTTSPSTLLHLNSSGASSVYLRTENTGGIGYFGVDSSGNAYAGAESNDAFGLVTNGTYRMYITAGGNVGIGTTSPQNNFVVSNGGNDGVEINPTGENSDPAIYSYSRSGDGYRSLTFVGLDYRFNAGSSPTERARIDSSGRLLVGTTSLRTTGWTTQVGGEIFQELTNYGGITIFTNTNASEEGSTFTLGKSRGSTAGSNTIVANNDRLGIINFQGTDGTAPKSAAWIQCLVDGTPGANDMPGRLVFSTTADGASSPTERMRINNAGAIWANSTGTGDYVNGTAALLNLKGSSGWTIKSYRTGTSSNIHISFENDNGQVGTITTSASATAFNTSSDYRLKENVEPVTNGIARLQQLKPSRFNFIADPDKTVDGFIAHEVQTVVPEAITGEKDAVDAEGNPVYQGIDQSKLVPLLTAALQEAVIKIEQLEATNASFEARLSALEVKP